MKQQNIFLATNIKKLRERKKWSQDEMAQKLGISRIKLTQVELGNTKNPPLEDLINFSAVLSIGVDTLLKVDLRKMSELKIRELEAGNDAFATGTKLRVLSTTVDKDNNENSEFVPVKAKAGYAAGYADPEYIAALPKFSMPQLPKQRTYRMFPTSGPSMLPIPENCFVIGEFVQDWKEIKDGTLCIVALKTPGADSFVFKQVDNLVKEKRGLLLKSLNPEFEPYLVPVAEILEVWKFVSYVSDTVPEGNISIGQIAQSLQSIQINVAKLAAKK